MASVFPLRELEDEATTDMVGALGTLLRQAGHRELAALLGGLFDACEVHHRRGGDPAFLASLAGGDDPVLTYVIDQLGQLADILEDCGETDRAALLRVPALLRAYRTGATLISPIRPGSSKRRAAADRRSARPGARDVGGL